MNNSNKCPNCRKYIFGYICYACKIDIREVSNNESIPDFFKDIFKENNDERS